MRKTILFCIALVVLAGCHSDFTPSPVMGVNLSGKLSQTINFADAQATGLSVSIVSIEESRCPSDVECIWAGEVKVNFLVDGKNITVKKGESAKFTFKARTYEIALIDVTPYPSTTNGKEERTVIFKVTA